MLLKQLIACLPEAKVEGPLDRDISGLAFDSRRVMPGMVYVALRGRRTDGHEFIDAAVDRGASGIICESASPLKTRATRIRVPDTRTALAQAAISFYGNPSAKLTTVGITGTNGKTVVAYMVKQIMEAAGLRTGLIGTVQYEVGDRVIPAQRTTPESLDLQQLMSQMVSAGCQACVMEVSSHALDQKRAFGVEFDTAVFTNLTHDHHDYHGSMENYFEAKKRLFSALSQSPKKTAAVINLDDAYGIRLAQEGFGNSQITYGLQSAAQIRASDIRLEQDGSRFVLQGLGQDAPCHLPLIGRHNVYNALAAAGTGQALGIANQAMVETLNKMPSVPGRLESIEQGQPFGVLVDYAHTDDALRNVLAALREITQGRVLVLFGCGGNRDAEKRSRMGRVAAELADYTCITSDNPRCEDPATIARDIEVGYQSFKSSDYEIELDRHRAIQEIIAQAQPDDTVLIAGKGHECFQEFEDTIAPFDDRVYAREALENLGYQTAP